MPDSLPLPVWVVVRNGSDGEWFDLCTVSHTQEGARTRANELDRQSSQAWRAMNKPQRIRRLVLAERGAE